MLKALKILTCLKPKICKVGFMLLNKSCNRLKTSCKRGYISNKVKFFDGILIKIIKGEIALLLFLKEVKGLNKSFYTKSNKGLKELQLTPLELMLVLF